MKVVACCRQLNLPISFLPLLSHRVPLPPSPPRLVSPFLGMAFVLLPTAQAISWDSRSIRKILHSYPRDKTTSELEVQACHVSLCKEKKKGI